MILVKCNHGLKNGKGLAGIARQVLQVIPCGAVDSHRAASEPLSRQSIRGATRRACSPAAHTHYSLRMSFYARPCGDLLCVTSARLQIYLECVKDYVCRYTPCSMCEGVENVDFLPAQLFQSFDIVRAD